MFFKYFILFGLLKNYLFIMAIISLFINFYLKGFNKKIIYIYIFYFLSFSFLLFAHILMSGDLDLAFMLKVNLHRLVFAISPFFILILIENLNLYIKKL